MCLLPEDVPITLSLENRKKATERLHQLELLLEAKLIEAEILRDPSRLVTDEELERQIARKMSSKCK